ncbi:hypothetical protein Vadar_031050 [Vaccinium darrowii]|uniref:Uncharacterized protein n=1 Tax=Vaccinium darrowii TaxID=229202 RepID=A0ACB7Z7C8_9ERIC|nr:hypothetical protein Vadar_031050 [Vaccinium darrowii]
MVHDQKQVLESKLLESCSVEDELEEKILEAVNLLMTFKEKRDKLQIEHDKFAAMLLPSYLQVIPAFAYTLEVQVISNA